MYYKFKCTNPKCEAVEDKFILISEYDKAKNLQICTKCKEPMKRVIEWEGFAEGHGDGWYGKDNV